MTETVSSTTVEEELTQEEKKAWETIQTSENEAEQGGALTVIANIKEIRAGIGAATRVTTTNTYTINNTISNGETAVLGLHDIEKNRNGLNIQEAITGNTQTMRLQVKQAMEHEKLGHQDSLQRAEVKGNKGMIARVIGTKEFTLFQELNASERYSKETDAYGTLRTEAVTIAGQMNLTKAMVLELIHNGDEDKVVNAAIDSGYITATPKN
jgi:hypothetical protein